MPKPWSDPTSDPLGDIRAALRAAERQCQRCYGTGVLKTLAVVEGVADVRSVVEETPCPNCGGSGEVEYVRPPQ